MRLKENQNLTGHLLAVLTVLCWGMTYISSKVVLAILTPVELLFLRFLIGLAVLLILHPKIMKWQGWKMELLMFGTGFFGVTLYFYLENSALLYTYASYVSLVVSTIPCLTAIACAIFFRDKSHMTLTFFGGFFLCMIGIGLVCLNGTRLDLNPIGILLAVGACLAWVVYSLLMNVLDQADYNLFELTRRMFLYALISMVPLMIWKGFAPNWQALCRSSALWHFLFLAVIASGLCYYTWNTALRFLGTIKATAYLYLDPVITTVFAFFTLGETITLLSAAGMVLTIAGLLLSNREKRKETGDKIRRRNPSLSAAAKFLSKMKQKKGANDD